MILILAPDTEQDCYTTVSQITHLLPPSNQRSRTPIKEKSPSPNSLTSKYSPSRALKIFKSIIAKKWRDEPKSKDIESDKSDNGSAEPDICIEDMDSKIKKYWLGLCRYNPLVGSKIIHICSNL